MILRMLMNYLGVEKFLNGIKVNLSGTPVSQT